MGDDTKTNVIMWCLPNKNNWIIHNTYDNDDDGDDDKRVKLPVI